jgi:ABC-2 type transport system permease protein
MSVADEVERLACREHAHRRDRARYFSLVSAALQRALTYRSARIIAVLSGIVVLAIQYFMWKSVFEVTPEVGELGWRAMQSYIVLAFAIGGLLPNEYEIGLFRSVQSGEVALELVRPLDFQWAQLAVATGGGLAELLFRSATTVAISLVWFDVGPPPALLDGLLFVASVGIGFVIRFLVSFLVGLCCFWLLNVWGLQWVRAAVTSVLSGATVPLALLPTTLRQIAIHSPFAGMLFVPTSIYTGHLAGIAALQALLVQLGWALALWFGARRLWTFSIGKLVVQGG